MEIDHSKHETLFRVCQEALNNCQKHAGVEKVEVKLEQSGDTFGMKIIDQGKGFQYDEQMSLPSLGLKGMAKRIRKAGGTFCINSELGKGNHNSCESPIFSRKEGLS